MVKPLVSRIFNTARSISGRAVRGAIPLVTVINGISFCFASLSRKPLLVITTNLHFLRSASKYACLVSNVLPL